MSETKTNGITMLIASNHIHVNADVTFHIEEQGDIPTVHISEVVSKLILDNLRQEDSACLSAGTYKGSMTLIVSGIEATEPVEAGMKEKSKKKALVKKKAPAKKKATKKRAVRKSKNS